METSRILGIAGIVIVIAAACFAAGWILNDSEDNSGNTDDNDSSNTSDIPYLIRYEVQDAVWNEDHTNMYIDIRWHTPMPAGVTVYVTCGPFDLGTDSTTGSSTMTINAQNQQLGSAYTIENLELYIPGHELVKL